MQKLLNKNIVITGASSGIGEKIAVKVAEMGARPILLARSVEKLSSLCEAINEKSAVKSCYYPLDVSDIEEVNTVFKQILKDNDHIDILINNAGFGIFDTFYEANFEDIEKMFAVNVLGLMACTKAVLPSMIGRNSGHIINIASQAGKFATAKSSGYSATKHAVLGFTNSLRMELVKTNIFVSAVNPGPIATNFFTIADKTGNYQKNVKKFMLKADYVAEQIVELMMYPKRELNMPAWMNAGSVVQNLFPSLFDKVAVKFLDKK